MLPLVLLAAASVTNAASLVRRGTNEVWNGVNITAAALEIEGAISSPTCNATTYCQTFVKQVVSASLAFLRDEELTITLCSGPTMSIAPRNGWLLVHAARSPALLRHLHEQSYRQHDHPGPDTAGA